MKKSLLVFIIGCISIIVLTGCGDSEKKVTCSTDLKLDGEKYGTSEVIALLDKSDNVKSAKVIITIDDKKEAENLYDYYKVHDDNTEDENMKYGVSINKNKITIDHFELFYTQNGSDVKIIGMSKKSFKDMLETTAKSKTVCKY